MSSSADRLNNTVNSKKLSERGSTVKEPNVAPKIGASHAPAMMRAGLKEIASILPAFPESVKPVEDMGLAGNALPQEIYKSKHEKEPHIDKNLEMQM